MELNNIKQTGTWGTHSTRLNENFSKINTEIQKLYGSVSVGDNYTTKTLTQALSEIGYTDSNVLQSYALKEFKTTYYDALAARVQSLEGGSAMSFALSGSGNVVTGVSKSGTAVTLLRDITALTQATGDARYILQSNEGGLNVYSTRYVRLWDNRSVALAPTDYNAGVWWDFKNNSVSISDGGSFTGMLTLRKYGNNTDITGGKTARLLFTDNSNMWLQFGATAWETAQKILTSTNYTSVIDSRYVLKSGDIMTGDLQVGANAWKTYIGASSVTNEGVFGIKNSSATNVAYMRMGANKLQFHPTADTVTVYDIWHAGNSNLSTVNWKALNIALPVTGGISFNSKYGLVGNPSDVQLGYSDYSGSLYLRSSESDLIHNRAGTNYTILDSYNALSASGGISVSDGSSGTKRWIADRYIGNTIDATICILLIAPYSSDSALESWSGANGKLYLSRGNASASNITMQADFLVSKAYNIVRGWIDGAVTIVPGKCTYNGTNYVCLYIPAMSTVSLAFTGRYSPNAVFQVVAYSAVTNWEAVRTYNTCTNGYVVLNQDNYDQYISSLSNLTLSGTLTASSRILANAGIRANIVDTADWSNSGVFAGGTYPLVMYGSTGTANTRRYYFGVNSNYLSFNSANDSNAYVSSIAIFYHNGDILASNNLSVTKKLSADTLNVTGALTGSSGTFSGSLKGNTVTVTSDGAGYHLIFSRASSNYISAPASGTIGFLPDGLGAATASQQFIVANGSIYSGTNNAVSCGTASRQWSDVRSVLGTFSSTLTTNNLVISDTTLNAHITFSRNSANYFYASDAAGTFAFVPNAGTIGTAGIALLINSTAVYSGVTNTILNGKDTNRWANVYSTLGNFSGDVTMSAFVGIGGVPNANYALNVTGDARSTGRIIAESHLCANRANSNAGRGLSLYGEPSGGVAPTYGIMFASSTTYGVHGSITTAGSWSTYFVMANTANRAWIFKAGSGATGNVFSIDVTGNIAANGETAAGQDGSDMRLKKDISDFDCVGIMRGIGAAFKYKWNDFAKKYNSYYDNDRDNYSWSAQQVQKYMPDAVRVGVFGGDILTLRKDQLLPIVWNVALIHENRICDHEFKLHEHTLRFYNHEDRITILERENKELRAEIKLLKGAA